MNQNEIINNGVNYSIQDNANKKASLYAGCVLFGLAFLVSTGAYFKAYNTVKAYEYQLKQRDSLITTLKMQNDDIIFDNIRLQNGK